MKLMISGKGGSGKSTVAALLAKTMEKRGKQVLLMDADESNIGLYRMLGMEMPQPLMDNLGGKKGFQARLKATGTGLGGLPPLFPKGMTLETLPKDCVAQTGNIRVMATGKIHHFGEGCACPMGNLFRMVLSSLDLDSQDLVIVDTAAGLEHFGRRLDKECDGILCVVDPSYESIMMAQRMTTIAKEADLPVYILLNKVTQQVKQDLESALDGLDLIGCLPEITDLFINTMQGKTLDLDLAEVEDLCKAIESNWT